MTLAVTAPTPPIGDSNQAGFQKLDRLPVGSFLRAEDPRCSIRAYERIVHIAEDLQVDFVDSVRKPGQIDRRDGSERTADGWELLAVLVREANAEAAQGTDPQVHGRAAADAQNAIADLPVVGAPVEGGMGFQSAATELARDLQWLDGMILVIMAGWVGLFRGLSSDFDHPGPRAG